MFDANSYNAFVAMNTTVNTSIQPNTPRFLQIIMGIAFAVIFVLGTCGNVLVIYVLGKRKKKVIIISFVIICQYLVNVNYHIGRITVTFSGSNDYKKLRIYRIITNKYS